jgi:glycosyltransferase involved in cell wall biosynthesis
VGNRHGDARDMTNDRLLVVVSEYVSEWIEKGEVVDRYYNPGDRFAEVHLLLTNDDDLRPEDVQRLVGSARAYVQHLPMDRRLFVRTAGWRPRLLRAWAQGAVEIAREVQPSLVRCYGAHVNGLCALEIRRALGVPFVVSLHTLPDDPAGPSVPWLWSRLEAEAIRAVRRRVLQEADLIIAVYASLVPYLERVGARRIEVVHNSLSLKRSQIKRDYELHDPVRVLSVGRQIVGKDPRVLIEAIAAIPGIQLTLVGDGALRHDVESLVARLGLPGRVEIVPAMTNDELVASLADYDLFVTRNDYRGVPKAVLEPLLAGLPVIVNRPRGVVPELSDDTCVLVDPAPAAYRAAIERMIASEDERGALGRRAKAWAWGALSPEVVEARVVELYDELIAESTLSPRR